MPRIILLGTLDTKLEETLYLRTQLLQLSSRLSTPPEIVLIDCGRQFVTNEAITISHSDLITKYAQEDSTDILTWPRGQVIQFTIGCVTRCVKELVQSTEVHGLIGIGGTGGTSLISAVMREAVPVGVPKMIASTIASGDTGPLVGETDITMMYSIVDIAGTNGLLRSVLDNAAGAILGMALAFEYRQASQKTVKEGEDAKKTRIGITMFGVTTPCVDSIRRHLESNYPVEVYVFHATGHGGKAMERLVEEGHLDAVIDLTTTEICDLIAGGNMSAEKNRLEAMLKRGIPTIFSVGATDMVNFGPFNTVPEHYRNRNLYRHNPSVTLMRTTVDECRQIGRFILDKIQRFPPAPDTVEVWLPRGGVSVIATPGGPFEDTEADGVLAEILESGLKDTGVRIVSDKRDINNEQFAVDIAESLMALYKKHSRNE